MYASALNSAVCLYCSNWVPFSWTRKKGLVFCLGTTCVDTQGHLFWEQPDAVDHPNVPGETSCSLTGSVYVQVRQNNKSQLLCNNQAGISILQSQWKHVYLLRFTLRMLIEIFQDDTTTSDLDLNACGNLWPNDSNQRTSDEAKLRLCKDA